MIGAVCAPVKYKGFRVTSRVREMDDGRTGRGLLLMRAGAHDLAVYADEADGVAEWREPVPLPHAPEAVLGVVSLRGRVRTVLDPAALLGAGGGEAESAPSLLVILRGDEQLALAVARAEEVGPAAELAPAGAHAPLARGAFRHEGGTVYLLDPAQLFAAATRGAERRRQRLEP